MDTLWQDVKYGFRRLRRTPAFTAVAILSLALGIGANTAIFSVVNAVLLRPLPYREPDRLVGVYLQTPGGNPRGPVSVIDFQDWREQSRAFSDLALINTLSRGLTLSGGVEPEQLNTAYVHPSFFSTLGVQPEVGRAPRLDENDPGRNHVAVISHGFWVRRFGSDPAVAGRQVTLDGQSFTIIGVMPASFRFPDPMIDIWAPESLIDAARAPRRRDTRYQRVIARLAEGVTLEAASTEMNAIAARLATAFPETNARYEKVNVVPLHNAVVGDEVRLAVFVLFGAVVLVLLIACVNVSNLLFARSVARQREIAVRIALGAGRLRIARQLLTESLVLAFLGGALGLLVGSWSLEVLLALSRDLLPMQRDIAVDGHVLGFTLLASIFSAAAFGCMPALRIARANPQPLLKEGQRGSTYGLEGKRWRAALAVTEIALALLLAVAAGLTIKSFDRLLRVDVGFNPRGVLTVFMNASSGRYPERAQYVEFYRQVLNRVQQTPGVVSAGSTRNLPLRSAAESWPVVFEGRPPVPAGSEVNVQVHQASPSYFRAMAIPLIRGRDFTDGDHEQTEGVAIINLAMARRFWPGEEPIGRRFGYASRTISVVGVVGDVRQTSLDREAQPAIYVPQVQDPRRGFTLVIRTSGDPQALAPTVRREIQAVDPEHPILRIATMEEMMGDAVAQPRLMTILLGIFGGLAMCLAILGVYGVIAYGVGQRTHEFGVRMALGARPNDVMAIVLRDGLVLALVGIAMGTSLALGLTRILSSQLYEVSATDPVTFLGVAGLLLGASLAAGYIPARRAARVDPMVALRYE